MEKEIEKRYVSQMKSEQGKTDKEVAHLNADTLLINFLRELGYHDLVDEWEKVEKWYA